MDLGNEVDNCLIKELIVNELESDQHIYWYKFECKKEDKNGEKESKEDTLNYPLIKFNNFMTFNWEISSTIKRLFINFNPFDNEIDVKKLFKLINNNLKNLEHLELINFKNIYAESSIQSETTESKIQSETTESKIQSETTESKIQLEITESTIQSETEAPKVTIKKNLIIFELLAPNVKVLYLSNNEFNLRIKSPVHTLFINYNLSKIKFESPNQLKFLELIDYHKNAFNNKGLEIIKINNVISLNDEKNSANEIRNLSDLEELKFIYLDQIPYSKDEHHTKLLDAMNGPIQRLLGERSIAIKEDKLKIYFKDTELVGRKRFIEYPVDQILGNEIVNEEITNIENENDTEDSETKFDKESVVTKEDSEDSNSKEDSEDSKEDTGKIEIEETIKNDENMIAEENVDFEIKDTTMDSDHLKEFLDDLDEETDDKEDESTINIKEVDNDEIAEADINVANESLIEEVDDTKDASMNTSLDTVDSKTEDKAEDKNSMDTNKREN